MGHFSAVFPVTRQRISLARTAALVADYEDDDAISTCMLAQRG